MTAVLSSLVCLQPKQSVQNWCLSPGKTWLCRQGCGVCICNARQTSFSLHRHISCPREFPGYECSLAPECTVLVVDR